MNDYNPHSQPDPEEWQELDEQEQIDLPGGNAHGAPCSLRAAPVSTRNISRESELSRRRSGRRRPDSFCLHLENIVVTPLDWQRE